MQPAPQTLHATAHVELEPKAASGQHSEWTPLWVVSFAPDFIDELFADALAKGRIADERVELALGNGFGHAHPLEFLFHGDRRKTRPQSQKIVTADIAPRSPLVEVLEHRSIRLSFFTTRRLAIIRFVAVRRTTTSRFHEDHLARFGRLARTPALISMREGKWRLGDRISRGRPVRSPHCEYPGCSIPRVDGAIFSTNWEMRHEPNSSRGAALAAAEAPSTRATAGRLAQSGSSLSPNRPKKHIMRRPRARPRPSQAQDRGPGASAGTGPRPRRSGSGVDLAPETPGTKSSGPRRRGS